MHTTYLHATVGATRRQVLAVWVPRKDDGANAVRVFAQHKQLLLHEQEEQEEGRKTRTQAEKERKEEKHRKGKTPFNRDRCTTDTSERQCITI